jgi:hypothetical protein
LIKLLRKYFVVGLLFFLAVLMGSVRVYSVEPPWDITAEPDTIYVRPPQCEGSFTITVTDFYKTTPITIFIEYVTNPYVPSGWLFDGTPNRPSKVGDWQSTVTGLFGSPWESPGRYTYNIYAYPSSMTLDAGRAYGVYANVTFVLEDTGVKTCSSGTTATATHTTIDMTAYTTVAMTHPTTSATYTWTYGTTTWGWWDWWWNWDYWWGAHYWPWVGEFDFSLAATPGLQSMKSGQSVSYSVVVNLVSGNAQPVTLSLTGLPDGISHTFSMQSADPTFTSAIQISSQPSLSPGNYTLTIVGTGGGKTHSANVNLMIAESMQPSSLSLSVNPSTLEVGGSVALGGALTPGSATTVEIVYSRPDGFEMMKHVTTSDAGAFSGAFKPDTPGPWSVKARWAGDAKHYSCESQPASFSVTGVPEKPPQPFWEQIPPIIVLAAILAIIISAILLLKHRTGQKKTVPTATARFCVKCGKTIPEGSGYCTNCGEKLR